MREAIAASPNSATVIDLSRLDQDPSYRNQLACLLLGHCGDDADHVELRRTAQRLFPNLARTGTHVHIGAIVGHAATLRAQRVPAHEGDVTDARLAMTATEPLPYPPLYADMDETTRSVLVSFCESQLQDGHDGPEALENLLRLHGWPYSERTFYVGPWKAARLRLRRRRGEN